MQTKDWVTLAISVLTLVAGSGWVKYFLERRDAYRKEAQAVLDGFLHPLEAILEQNKRFHALLTEDVQLRQLEYAPDYLQQHFAALPPEDFRRVAWKTLIDGVIEDNKRAKTLIQANHNKIHAPELRQRCFDFISHADSWAALWRATLSDTPVPDTARGARQLSAPPFPEGLDSLLAQEINEREREAGMKRR